MATLTFQDRTLHVIDRNGDKWLTVNDIAAALYPTNQRGSQIETPFVSRVRMLYKRNAEEFSDSMTALADGSLAARTLVTLTEADIEQVIKDLCKDRLRFLKRLKAWKNFGKGWKKRVDRVEKNALAMIAGRETVAATEPDGAALGLGQQKLSATVADNKAAAAGFMGAAGTALEQAADVKFSLLSVFDNIPSWVWLALVAGLFAYIIWSKHRVAVKD